MTAWLLTLSLAPCHEVEIFQEPYTATVLIWTCSRGSSGFILVRVILEYVLMLLWSFAEAPDLSGGRREMAMAAPPRCFSLTRYIRRSSFGPCTATFR